MFSNKYSNIERIILKNSHLSNEKLAKKVGKSVGWVKAFKAFMRAENKDKYKNSSNGMYRAIYNMWINDDIAQSKEYEENKLKKRIKELEKEKASLEEEMEFLQEDVKFAYKRVEAVKQEKEELLREFQSLENKYKNLLEQLEEHKRKIKAEVEKDLKEEYFSKKSELQMLENVLKERIERHENAKYHYLENERIMNLKFYTAVGIAVLEFIFFVFIQ